MYIRAQSLLISRPPPRRVSVLRPCFALFSLLCCDVLRVYIAPEKLDSLMPEFVRDNAGKAFEFMVDTANEERKAAGLGSVEEMFAGEGIGSVSTRYEYVISVHSISTGVLLVDERSFGESRCLF